MAIDITADTFAVKDPRKRIVHAQDIMIAATRSSKFAGLLGTDNSAIIKTSKAEGNKGAAIERMRVLTPMRGRGSRGNEDLDGQQGKLKYLWMDVQGNVIGEDVTSEHKDIESRSTVGTFRKDAKSGLEEWLKWTIDSERFAKLSRDCSRIVCVKADGTVSYATSDLAAGSTFGTKNIDEARDRAKNGYTVGTGDDAVRYPKLKPYKIEVGEIKGIPTEKEIFVMFIGGASAKNLSEDPLWEQKRQSLSEIQKDKYPFAGGMGLYDEEIIVVNVGTWNEEDAGIVTSSTEPWIDVNNREVGGFEQYEGAGGVEVEVNLLFGAGAGVQPFQAVPDYQEDGKTIDSGRKLKVFVDTWFGFEKFRPQAETDAEKNLAWHDKDFGVMAVPATLV